MSCVNLLGKTSLYLFFSSAPGGTSAMVTILEGTIYKNGSSNLFGCTVIISQRIQRADVKD